MAPNLRFIFRFVPKNFPTHSFSFSIAALKAEAKLLRRVLASKVVMTRIVVAKNVVIGKSRKMLWGKSMVDRGNNGNYYNALERTVIQCNHMWFKFQCVWINVQGMVGTKIMIMGCTSWREVQQ